MHILEWFERSEVCAVAGCDCELRNSLSLCDFRSAGADQPPLRASARLSFAGHCRDA